MENYNRTHPNLPPGYVFVCNILPGRKVSGISDWDAIPYMSKIMGLQAYNARGDKLNNYIPVFAARSEVRNMGHMVGDCVAITLEYKHLSKCRPMPLAAE
jgi:hypothetical protein